MRDVARIGGKKPPTHKRAPQRRAANSRSILEQLHVLQGACEAHKALIDQPHVAVFLVACAN